MLRECVAMAVVATLCPGCSLLLDFDGAPPIAVDAAIDAVYSQTECDFKEPNDSLAEAMDVTASDTGPAAICAGTPGGAEDHDFYRFTAAGGDATIAIAFMSRPGGDLDLRLLATDGTLIAQSRGFGDGETIVCPGSSPACPQLTAATSYIVEVLPGVSGAVNRYTLALTITP